MAMTIAEKTAIGKELLGVMEVAKGDPEIMEGAMLGVIGRLVVNGEKPWIVGELVALALADDCTNRIAEALIEGIKEGTEEDDKIKSFKDGYNGLIEMAIVMTKRLNPDVVDFATPFRTVLGHAFIEAGQRICNGEAE